MNYNNLTKQIQELIQSKEFNTKKKLQRICDHLQKEVPHYDWVGFYFAQPDTQTLHLGPYAGTPTDHLVIPFGKGICGQVAVSNENFIVPDVSAQDNYIACSTTVKSEIVIPLIVRGKNIGQIDIDSHKIDAFGPRDVNFLEQMNQMLTELF